MPQLGKPRPQLGEHRQIVEAAKLPRQDQHRCIGEAQDELDLAAAEIAMELAERKPASMAPLIATGKSLQFGSCTAMTVVVGQSERQEIGREPSRARVIVGIGQPHPPVDDRDLAGRLCRPPLEHVVAGDREPIAALDEIRNAIPRQRRIRHPHRFLPRSVASCRRAADVLDKLTERSVCLDATRCQRGCSRDCSFRA